MLCVTTAKQTKGLELERSVCLQSIQASWASRFPGINRCAVNGERFKRGRGEEKKRRREKHILFKTCQTFIWCWVNVFIWLSQIFFQRILSSSMYVAVIFMALARFLHRGNTLLGNLGEFEGIHRLCSDAPIIFASSWFHYSRIQIWPQGKRWAGRRAVGGEAEPRASNWLIKTSNGAAIQPTFGTIWNNITFKCQPQSVSAVWFKKCMNFKRQPACSQFVLLSWSTDLNSSSNSCGLLQRKKEKKKKPHLISSITENNFWQVTWI